MSTQILMPALSPTMEEGKLAKWHVKEGDTVKTGDILAEIETDKATMEFESIDEGRVGKLLVPEGAEAVKVNTPIAVLLGEGEASESAPASDIPTAMKAIREALGPVPASPPPVAREQTPAPSGGQPQQTAQAAPQPARPAPAPTAEHREANGARIFASPLARRIAQNTGIDLAALQGSGPRGRIVKADVEAASRGAPSQTARAAVPPSQRQREAAPSAPSTSVIAPLPDARLFYREGDYDLIPHDSMRKTISKSLTSA